MIAFEGPKGETNDIIKPAILNICSYELVRFPFWREALGFQGLRVWSILAPRLRVLSLNLTVFRVLRCDGLRAWPIFVLGFQTFHSQIPISRIFEIIWSMMLTEVIKSAFECIKQRTERQ